MTKDIVITNVSSLMILRSQILATKPKTSPNKGPPRDNKQKLPRTPETLDVSPIVS